MHFWERERLTVGRGGIVTTEIQLTKGYVAIVDDLDADLTEFNWSYMDGYAIRWGKRQGKTCGIFMHRVILERMLGRPLAPKERGDHIHHNTLDNRRSELRPATNRQNVINGRKREGISGYRGVAPSGYRGKYGWKSSITVDGKAIKIGIFDTPLEAHRQYCIAALTHHKEFAHFGNNSPFTGFTLADFEKPIIQLALPLDAA